MNVPPTMRALQQTALTGPQGLRLISDAPVPRPGSDEILVRVAAAGVNFADLDQATGLFGNGPQPPYLAGFEAAGEIVAVGEAVTNWATGAHVVGAGFGAFAEYVILGGYTAVSIPTGWNDAQALGMVVSWPAAVAALRPLGDIAAGQTVLIHAAAGGTGQAAVRIAKHYGAIVIGTASGAKHEIVRGLGADHVLDSRASDLASEVLRLTDGAGVDLVVESVGGATFDVSLAAAKRITGRVVVIGMSAGKAELTNWDMVYRNQVHVVGFNLGALIQFAPQIFGEVMNELSALIASGVLVPTNPTVYPLSDGARALADLANRSTVGKLALVP